MNAPTKWSDDDDRRLLELKVAGASSRIIAFTLKRTVSAIEQHFYILRERAAKKRGKSSKPGRGVSKTTQSKIKKHSRK